MGFNINDLLNYKADDGDQLDLPPVPLRPDYVPEQPAINPVISEYLMKKNNMAPRAPAVEAPPTPPVAPVAAEPSAYDQFNSQFGDEAFSKSQDEANAKKSNLGWLQLLAGVGDAFAGRSASNSASAFDQIRKNVDANTTGKFERQKAAALQDFSTKKTLENSSAGTPRAKMMTNLLEKLQPGVYAKEDLDKMSADDVEAMMKSAEFKAKLDQAKATQEMAHEDRQLKNETYKMQLGDRLNSKTADAYQKATHDLNTFRGNNAVQQASAALTNAKNAMSLADKGNLSPDQLHLFASEMGKLATGGVPGHSEIAALIPDTMQTRLSKVTQFFSNSPSDADAQKFINNNKQYLKELIHNYGSVVDTYRSNTLDGYKRKLSPEDYRDLQKRYSPAPEGNGPGPKPGTVEDGHRFKGGDPSKPENWEAI